MAWLTTRRAVIGIVTTALVACGGTATALATTEDSPGGTYCADMPDAAGLYTGNPVTQMGYQVGKISGVSARGTYARVQFELDAGRNYPANVVAVTRSKSLLADRSLELVGNWTGGPTLQPGACVPLDRSYSPKSLSDIASSASTFIAGLTEAGNDNVKGAVNGLDAALRGLGVSARTVMTQAASAAKNPDKTIADIGTVIGNMSPLTEDALANWGQIQSIVVQLPQVLDAGTDLWVHSALLTRGVGWVVALLYDIQRKYGSELWPIVHGPVTDAIAVAAGRMPEVSSILSTIPSLANAVKSTRGTAHVQYSPATVRIPAGNGTFCAAINVTQGGACRSDGGSIEVAADALLTALVNKGN